jgi:hypothetical protein
MRRIILASLAIQGRWGSARNGPVIEQLGADREPNGVECSV